MPAPPIIRTATTRPRPDEIQGAPGRFAGWDHAAVASADGRSPRAEAAGDLADGERDRSTSQRRRLTILLALNAAMIVGLVVVGFLAHSLGVLAAGGDYVADSAAILLGIIAVGVRERVGRHSKAPTYVAALNATALLVVTALVLTEAVRRLLYGTPVINGLPVLVVSAIATAVMVAGVFVLGPRAGGEDLHMRSVLLDTVSDALASGAVAISGAVLYVTGRYYWLDSLLSLAIAVVVAVGAVRLLVAVVVALRQGTDLDIDHD
jgi:cobalt-zinc-cadmium efflux system protein